MSMIALISTVINQSGRRLTTEVEATTVVNASTIYDPELEGSVSLLIEPSSVANTNEFYDPELLLIDYLLLEVEHVVNINYFSVAALISGAALVETDYANEGGTGSRFNNDVNVRTTNAAAVAIGEVNSQIDGTTGSSPFYVDARTDLFMTFEFLYPVVITEVKFYQGNSSTHGFFKWQGGNDNASWSDIGSSFELGGSTEQTITELAANGSAYNFYRLIAVSGTSSSSPFWHEFEFEIGFNPTSYSFLNGEPLNDGDRTALITVTQDGFLSLFGGTGSFVDGSQDSNWYCAGGTDAWVKFDLGSGNEAILRGARVYRSGLVESGTWEFQGSNDDSTWDPLSDPIILDRFETSFFAGGNTTAYRYYRLQQVAGTNSGSPYWLEVTFAQDDGTTGGGGGPDPEPEAELFPEVVVNSSTIYAAQIDFGDAFLVLFPGHFENINYFFSPIIVAGNALPAPSYSNYMGTGDRSTSDISIEVGYNTAIELDLISLIDGNTTGGSAYAQVDSGVFWLFEFPYAVLITESRWIHSAATSGGTYKWQGSNDGTTWTDIGSSFTLGGATTQTMTSLSGNVTLYDRYRLTQVSGSNPFFIHREAEFKIAAPDNSPSFNGSSALCRGNRTGLLTVTLTGFTSGAGNDLIDGSSANVARHTGTTTANAKFDFGTAIVLKAVKLERDANSTSSTAVWRLEGSNDDSTWTVLSGNKTACIKIMTFYCRDNSTAYRYYRLVRVSGDQVGVAYWREVYFAVAASGGGGDDPEPEAELFPIAVTNSSTIYAAEVSVISTVDPLWANVAFLLDTRDHSASAESDRIRHHAADSNVGMFIPLSNAFYTSAQKLPGRDYSMSGGVANDMPGVFGLDFNTAGGFTIEGRVRRGGTGQQLLIHQGVGSNVVRFGFENGNNARLIFSYTTSGVTWINVFSLAAVVSSTHAWKHIAANRGADNVLRLFVDGVMVAKATVSSFVATPIETKLNVGAGISTGGLLFYDDVRITLGANRYGSDASFAPPDSLYRGSVRDIHWANVGALQRFNARAGYLGKPGISFAQVYLADASRAGAHDEGAGRAALTTGSPDGSTGVVNNPQGFVRTKATGAAGVNLAGGIEWTIEAQATLADVADVSGVLCAREGVWTSAPGSTDKQWRLGFTSDAKPYFEAQLVGGSTFTLTAAAALTKAVWFRLAADCDGTVVRLYADGVMVAKGTMSAAIADPAPSTKAFYMFGGSGSGGSGFRGVLDEVRVTKAVARYNSDAGYTPAVGRFPAY